MATFVSEYFEIDEDVLDTYGAFNISTINDLPLFIDPFLLFHSEKEEYIQLHNQIIDYLIFLRDKAASGLIADGLLRSWYCFPEVKQTWLGFSEQGNRGHGLGIKFARTLHSNLYRLFSDFGEERITKSSHLEKVCLIADGVGKDNISDFTTNLIKDYLCKFTETFSLEFLKKENTRRITINNARFNFSTQTWERKAYTLPWINGDYVILTPKDMLTRDDNWINKVDLIHGIELIPTAIPNVQLRAQISNYFNSMLVRPGGRASSQKERDEAAVSTILKFPELIDYYIKIKEQMGDKASDVSAQKVSATQFQYVNQLMELQKVLLHDSNFYRTSYNTYQESHSRLSYLKDVIENKGGHKIFYQNGLPIRRESDLQILYRLVWFGTPSDAGTEANDGRGPVDFKISRGRTDKTLIEMKLASNTHLERNLQKQAEIYKAASDAKHTIKVILFFSLEEEAKVKGILRKLDILGERDVVLIDARNDNKPSGSKA